MSLESTVSGLVQSTTRLTDVVDRKMAEIDDKVDDAVKDIPAEIVRSTGRRIYLDQSSGDDANDGRSSETPIQSFSKIGTITPSGASVEVVLLSDYTFDAGERVEFDNNSVWIRSYSTEEKRTINFAAYIDNSGSYTCNNFFVQRNCFINFNSVNLKLPSVPVGAGTYNQQSAIVGSNSGADVGTPLSIRLGGVSIDVPDPANNQFAITPGYGMVMLSAAGVDAPAAWVDAGRVLWDMPPADMRSKVRLMYDSDFLVPAQ